MDNTSNITLSAAATTIVATLLGYAAGEGWIDGQQVGVLAGAIVAIGAAIIHVVIQRTANKPAVVVAKAAAIVPIDRQHQVAVGAIAPGDTTITPDAKLAA